MSVNTTSTVVTDWLPD